MPFWRAKRGQGHVDSDAESTLGPEPQDQPGALEQFFRNDEESRDPAQLEETPPDAPSGAEPAPEPMPEPMREPMRARFRRARSAFWRWRHTRPFWAGVLCLLGGVIITYGPLSVIRFVLVAGTVVWAGILMGLLVCAMGLFMWFTPEFRQILGVLAALFSVVSLVTSNFGGFLIGLLLGVIGGGMAFAWTPVPARPVQSGAPPAAPAPPSQPDARETPPETPPETPRETRPETTPETPPASEPHTSSTVPVRQGQRPENGPPAPGEDPLTGTQG